jgi:hypothetical protein
MTMRLSTKRPQTSNVLGNGDGNQPTSYHASVKQIANAIFLYTLLGLQWLNGLGTLELAHAVNCNARALFLLYRGIGHTVLEVDHREFRQKILK